MDTVAAIGASKTMTKSELSGSGRVSFWRKQKWNALVRNSKPLDISTDDIDSVFTTATDSTQSHPTSMACDANDNRGTQLSSERDCRCFKKYCDCRSVGSRLSVLSPSNTSSASSLASSPPPPSDRKRRKLNADCPTTTKYSCHGDAHLYRSDGHYSQCCGYRIRRARGSRRRRRRRRYVCQHEPHHHCADKRLALPDEAASYRQYTMDHPPLYVTPTERSVFSRPALSYSCRSADTTRYSQTPRAYGLVKQEPPEAIVHSRSCYPPSVLTSPSFAHYVQSASTLSDKSVISSVEPLPIPLEPVKGFPPSMDPRRLRQRQQATNESLISSNGDEPNGVSQLSDGEVNAEVFVLRQTFSF